MPYQYTRFGSQDLDGALRPMDRKTTKLIDTNPTAYPNMVGLQQLKSRDNFNFQTQ
jgi:hypothetical protein